MVQDTQAAPQTWPRVKWTRAAQVLPLLGDVPAVESVGAMAPAEAFAALRGGDPATPVRFMAHCLPRVDAVRWVAACLADAERNPSPARVVAAKAVRRWVGNPCDEARRAAFDAGSMAGFDTTEGLACLAVFLSGGSMAPATQEVPVNPPPGVFGQVAAGAVLLAAHADGARAAGGRIAAMLAKAEAIAAGEPGQ